MSHELDEWKACAEKAEAERDVLQAALDEIYADAAYLEREYGLRDPELRKGVAWMIDRLRNMRDDRDEAAS